MRPFRSLLIYFTLVFIGGALFAPWLYWLAHQLAANVPAMAKLASNPFSRFVDRSLLGAALIGIWPLLRFNGTTSGQDMGLTTKKSSAPWLVARGFAVGFGSLACVAIVAILFGARLFNATHSGGQILGRAGSAALIAAIVAFLEEILFRGTLFGILRKTFSWQTALVISSAVYALVHFMQKANPPAVVQWWSGLAMLPKLFQNCPPFMPALLTLFIAGAILAVAYQRSGSLFFSMGLHGGWIFWLKFYSFLTVTAPSANSVIWGTDRLIDGWVALFIMCGVFGFVWKTNVIGETRDPK